jgi:hypothetical protein
MVATGTHSDPTQGGKMKAIRTHDYRIEGYGNVNFVKVDIGRGSLRHRRPRGTRSSDRFALLPLFPTELKLIFGLVLSSNVFT